MNVHFVFDNKNEKAELSGSVRVYVPDGHVLYDCKIEKEVLSNGWCRIKDDLDHEWYGKVKYLSNKQCHIFESKTQSDEKFLIDLKSGIIRIL